MGPSDGNLEDEGWTDSGGLSHEISEVKNWEMRTSDEVLSDSV